MDDTLWFEEEIFPSDESVQMVAGTVKGLDAGLLAEAMEALGLGSLLETLAGMTKAQREATVARRARETFRGIIRAHKPAAFALAAGTRGRGGDALPYARGAAYLVRLSVEFDLPEELKEAHYFYRKVYCRATLTADGQECLPTVLEVYPDRLIEGGPRLVKVEFKPALKWATVEGSLGSAAGDVQVGVVAPATLGFLGAEQRAPYWEMTEQQQAILGRYNFWFVLDVPAGCDPATVQLGLLGEGDLKFRLGPFPMGPRRRERRPEQWITLGEIIGRGK